jgi:excisionase family DNA binding protein
MTSPFWTISEAMEYLGIKSRTTMFKLLKDGFPHAKIGRKLIFRQSDIDAWIEARIVKPKKK